ncbi:hypothetical protein MFMK1_003619 [Metallumcola ferriviriculae]|uniref:NADH dehydrogenase subunit 6 n=1 Tax=Metallumcola ferriviriculae TaxID=3039180 RepID=A0AAU0UV05_9FIRM|nr:hypothetical protein MFMK1_003619 [Desulfitibacteraceae bacterium MK1]
MYDSLMLTFGALVITGLSVLLAAEGITWLYWVGGLSMYFFSYMISSVYALSISFVILALALAYAMKWITSFRKFLITVISAIVIWRVSILITDDSILFLPAAFIFKVFGLS